jgi:predicted transposase YbfD/YdcC
VAAGAFAVAGGDYVLALKGNQGKLHRAVQAYILTHMENDFADVVARKHDEVVTGHGRVDTLTYYQLPVPKSLTQRKFWKGLRTIGVAIRISQQNGKETSDVRYYINSLRPGVRRFATAVRGHWGIENTLHWCLDVTFREDQSRLRDRHAADNVAWLKRFAISLLKQQTDKQSIAMRRRIAGANKCPSTESRSFRQPDDRIRFAVKLGGIGAGTKARGEKGKSTGIPW